MLPRATCQSSFHHCGTLSMEQPLVFYQKVAELSSTDRHSNCLQEVQDFRLAHPCCVVDSQDPRSDAGSKLTGGASWKSRQIRPFLTGRVVIFFAEPNLLGTQRKILHYDSLFCIIL